MLDVFKEKGGAHLDLVGQYYGQVIENFECENSIQTAVEVTAGGRYKVNILFDKIFLLQDDSNLLDWTKLICYNYHCSYSVWCITMFKLF